MTCEQFWHGNPRLARSFREADAIRREREAFAEWRNGVYTLRALGAAWDKDSDYPDFPLFVGDESPSRRVYEEMKMRANVAKMEAFMTAFNAKFARRD